MRALTPAIVAKIKAGIVKPVIFVFADFPGEPWYLWSGLEDKEWDGHTWKGVGGLIGFETFAESVDTSAKGIAARLNGLDPDLVSTITGTAYQGRDAIIYLGFWDVEETTLDVNEDPLWKGFLDVDEIEDAKETNNLVIKGEHRLNDALRKREYRYTDQDQQLLHPGAGDTGLNKIEQIQDTSAPWGRTQQ